MDSQSHVVTFKGQPLTLAGRETVEGPAPNFVAVTPELEQREFNSYRGRPVVLVSVPSLDTSVCDAEVRRLNEEATNLADDLAVVAISMDLPFAQGRWGGAHGIERVDVLSDHRDAAFGKAYGVLIKELRLLARAVWVIDRNHNIRYTELVPELSDHPDYEAALTAAREVA